MLRNRLGDRIVVAVAAACVLVLGACELADGQQRRRDIGDTDAGLPKPGPDPAARAPQPEYSDNVRAHIYLECTWHGRRWFHVTVLHNDNPRPGDPRQVKYTQNGRDFAGGRGSTSATLIAAPGDTVGIVCSPMTDETPYLTYCKIVHHNRQVHQDGPTIDRRGVVCGYLVPGGPR